MVGSRYSQAKTNYLNKSTGQLSLMTFNMILWGSLARIFTSLQETSDSMMITIFVINTLGAGVIVGQILYYKSGRVKTEDKKD